MKNALWILYNADMRCQVHSCYEVDGVFIHDDKRCPKCIIEYHLGLSTGWGCIII